MKQRDNYGTTMGFVKWFDRKKGIGFIQVISDGEHNGNDMFFHFSNINTDGYKTVFPGEYVSFDIKMNTEKNKLNAVNIGGIMGYPLLTENDKTVYKCVPRKTKNEDDELITEDMDES